jgi:DNA-binding beta-propeller fold protein YncE
MDRSNSRSRRWFLALGFGVAGAIGITPLQAENLCGGAIYPFPYIDVSGVAAPFCLGIMEAYVTGVSKGTTPTTFSPDNTVTRVQMTTFLQRTLDQGLARTSRRAALNQWWTPQNTDWTQTITLGGSPQFCAADGANIWVSTSQGNIVQLEASTGLNLNHWFGGVALAAVLVVGGEVFATENMSTGVLDSFYPWVGPRAVLSYGPFGSYPAGLAFDGTNIWTANEGGSVSIMDPQIGTLNTVTTGFESLDGILYDGANIWVTDFLAGTLLKLDPSGNILKTVAVGEFPQYPVFDGANIWVPNLGSNSITVVQVSTATTVATIAQDTSNQLSGPSSASFDGERVLVTNYNGNSVTLFKAADLSFIANVSTGAGSAPNGACSDGINFWIPLTGTKTLLRF